MRTAAPNPEPSPAEQARDQARADLRRKPRQVREDMALNMRLSGASYQQINQSFGYARVSTVEKLVIDAMKRRVDEPVLQVRTLDIERLDRMLAALWPQVLVGDQGAIKTAIRVMQQKEHILPGLSVPTRLAGFDGGAIQIEDVSASKDALREKLIDLAERRKAREQAS